MYLELMLLNWNVLVDKFREIGIRKYLFISEICYSVCYAIYGTRIQSLNSRFGICAFEHTNVENTNEISFEKSFRTCIRYSLRFKKKFNFPSKDGKLVLIFPAWCLLHIKALSGYRVSSEFRPGVIQMFQM